MDSKNERIYSKENYLANGHKIKNPYSKNQIVHTIQEPALNESGIEEETDLIEEDETSLLDCEDETNLLDDEDETSLLGMSEEDEEETSLLGEEEPEDGFSEVFTKEFEIIVTHSDTVI